MIPPDTEQVKLNMRKYYKPITTIKPLVDDCSVELPSISRIDQSLQHIAFKADLGPLSSPTRHLLKTTFTNANRALYQGEVLRVHADNLTQRVQEMTTKKPHNRKRVQLRGRLTVADARAQIEKKDKEKAEKEAKAEKKMLDSIVRRQQNQLHRAGITA
jgi:hypothetical protein